MWKPHSNKLKNDHTLASQSFYYAPFTFYLWLCLYCIKVFFKILFFKFFKLSFNVKEHRFSLIFKNLAYSAITNCEGVTNFTIKTCFTENIFEIEKVNIMQSQLRKWGSIKKIIGLRVARSGQFLHELFFQETPPSYQISSKSVMK